MKTKSKLHLEMKKAGVTECMQGWYCKACIKNYKNQLFLAEETKKFFQGFAYRKKK